MNIIGSLNFYFGWLSTLWKRPPKPAPPERCPITVKLGDRLIGQWTLTAKDANAVCRINGIDKILDDGDSIDIEACTESAANEVKSDVEFYLYVEKRTEPSPGDPR